jgi:antitoxin VapB
MEGQVTMQTAKIFQNGRSQAVRLPKEFRFKGKEVYIKKIGSDVILSSKPDSWEDFFFSDKKVSHDFMIDKEDLILEERDLFK